jgi:hypothetical protein
MILINGSPANIARVNIPHDVKINILYNIYYLLIFKHIKIKYK